MATTSDPWGRTPLTAEGLASLDHPLSLSDFNQDAGGFWRIVRGQKTYDPREWFDAGGTFTGTGTQPGDRAGQDQGFFKTGMHWNWEKGQWENPTNWANVIGLAAAGGVGGAFAAPIIAGALGGGGAAAGGGVGLGETGAVTGLGGSGFGTGAGLGYAAVAPSVGEVVGASGGIGTLSGTTPVLEGVAAGPGAITAPSVGEAVGGTGLATGGPTGYVGADILGTEAASTAPGLASYPTLASVANAGPVAGSAGGGAGITGALAPTVGGASTATKILQGVTGTGGGAAGAYSWLGPVVGATLNTIGLQQQIGATKDAAQTQADALKYAADAQAKAAADSLAFQRAQAAYNAQVAESTRAANYGQWAAKQQQLGSVGQALGLPARAIPAYVPLPPDASLSPGTPAAPSAGTPAAPPAAPPIGITDPGQGGNATATAPTTATPAGADAAWWNAQDPRGSVAKLFGGAAPTSQAILDRKAQIEAAGGQVSPPNAEGVTSKIYLPGVGWTRILDGGVAGGPGGGQGTGWTYVPQGPSGGGGAPGATAPRLATGNTDALGAISPYLLDPTQATGRIALPRYQPLGAVGSYV
jgi:hypothetical protein